MNDNNSFIPMQEPIDDFITHLSSHSQTIVSAKYGDGKSVFLEEFNKCAIDYTILTIFPVNYQIVENKDIFELIKRDILFQMIANDMINEGYEVADDVALYFFMQNKFVDLADCILPYLAEIDTPGNVAGKVISAYSCLKLFKSLRGKFNDFKNKGDISSIIDSYFSKVENHYSIEEDVITRIIKDNINWWRNKTGKKVAIVFEDMDRIDPAHIFRIMNVLSAHMDYAYKYGISPKDYIAGNKFDADNIILVLDYNSLKQMFLHFYGSEDAFEGYIHKFAPKGCFYYSLAKHKKRYFAEKIINITGVSPEYQKLIEDRISSDMDLRKLSLSCNNIKQQILPRANYKTKKGMVTLSNQILSLMIVMRRLNYSDMEIKKTLMLLDDKYLYELCSVSFLEYFKGNLDFPCEIYIAGIETRKCVKAKSLFENGNIQIELSSCFDFHHPQRISIDVFIDYLFKYISH